MPEAESLTFKFHSTDPCTNQLLAKAVDTLLPPILRPPTPPTPLSYLPLYSYHVLDEHLRRTYLPQHLSEDALKTVGSFLPIDGNWNTLLDLAPTLTDRQDRVSLIGAVAHIEAWLRFNPPPPSFSDATPGGY